MSRSNLQAAFPDEAPDIARKLQPQCGEYAIEAAKAAMARAARFADQNGVSYWAEVCAIMANSPEASSSCLADEPRAVDGQA